MKNEKFNLEVDSTTSPSYFTKILTVENKIILLNIWDTAGQEKFRSMNKIFIKGSNIILFIYDISRKKTLKELSFWTKYVESIIDKDSAIFGIVGNKLDLFDKEEELEKEQIEYEIVNTEDGKEFANQVGAEFLETSAKENAPGFIKFIDKLVAEYIKTYEKVNEKNNASILLDGKEGSLSNKFSCC